MAAAETFRTHLAMCPLVVASADGFGLGGSLYRPGQSPAEVGAQAQAFVATLAHG